MGFAAGLDLTRNSDGPSADFDRSQRGTVSVVTVVTGGIAFRMPRVPSCGGGSMAMPVAFFVLVLFFSIGGTVLARSVSDHRQGVSLTQPEVGNIILGGDKVLRLGWGSLSIANAHERGDGRETNAKGNTNDD